MLLKNAEILNGDFHFVPADIRIAGEKIAAIGRLSPDDGGRKEEVLDFSGCRIIPGLIDMHIHGSAGSDACDATAGALETISKHLAKNGVTSFAATSMSVDIPLIRKIFAVVRESFREGLPGAYLQGINMEGPYISVEKKGAQSEKNIRKPDFSEFRELYEESGGLIRVVDVAPEVEGAEAFIRQASKLCAVSVAHTAAGYEQTTAAFGWGVTHATHLFNGMTGFAHRQPGTVGAILDGNVTAELIGDGIHVHPAAIRVAWKALGPDRVVLISDAMSAAGMPDGRYRLGGQDVFVKDGAARLAGGSLAGSTANVMQCVRNAIRFGIPTENAVKAATINPARELGCDRQTGSIETGKLADLVVVDGAFAVQKVFIKGRMR